MYVVEPSASIYIWGPPAAAKIIAGTVGFAYLTKLASGSYLRLQRLVWVYLSCLLFVVIYAWTKNISIVDSFSWLPSVMGLINALALYCYLRAVNISQSISALFYQGTDLVAMLLAVIFLGEGRYLSIQLAVGIMLCFLAAAMLIRQDGAQPTSNIIFRQRVTLAINLGCALILWGTAAFSLKYFASDVQMLTQRCMLNFYFGSAIGAVLMFLLSGQQLRTLIMPIKQIALGVGIAVSAILSTTLAYITYKSAPLIVIQPLYQLSDVIFPLFIGLYVFHERKDLRRQDMIAMGIALTGAVLTATVCLPG